MGWESAELRRLFAPLILTPGQYYDERRDDSAPRPIKRLMLAILEDALICLRNHANAKNRKHQLMYREAEQWLCREGGNAPFSFGMVCETLGIEPNYLRSGLRQWSETQPRLAVCTHEDHDHIAIGYGRDRNACDRRTAEVLRRLRRRRPQPTQKTRTRRSAPRG